MVKRTLGLLTLLLLLIPASAAAERMYAKWFFRGEADINAWNAAGITQGTITKEGDLAFAVHEQGTLFRPLPEGFSDHVDALKIYIDPSTLDEVALLLLKTDDTGEIVRRFRLALAPSASSLAEGEYIPLAFYRPQIAGMEILAVSFLGEADTVSFGGIRFIDYSPWEKMLGMLRSFWLFDGFQPYTINIAIGPIVIPDPGPVEAYDRSSLTFATSVNAYFFLFLSLAGVALLLRAVFRARFRSVPWVLLRAHLLRSFGIIFLVVWLSYDARMGLEFLYGVARDHREYIAAPEDTRTFRDRSQFYDFAAFASGLVQDRKQYELFLPIEYPYFGSMRYLTYPALPNPGDPVADTWVVYRRPDITLGEDRRLHRGVEAFTRPGTILGKFHQASFVFREDPLPPSALRPQS